MPYLWPWLHYFLFSHTAEGLNQEDRLFDNDLNTMSTQAAAFFSKIINMSFVHRCKSLKPQNLVGNIFEFTPDQGSTQLLECFFLISFLTLEDFKNFKCCFGCRFAVCEKSCNFVWLNIQVVGKPPQLELIIQVFSHVKNV